VYLTVINTLRRCSTVRGVLTGRPWLPIGGEVSLSGGALTVTHHQVTAA
jgi:hypothetical protein